jgi:hypothetical protein
VPTGEQDPSGRRDRVESHADKSADQLTPRLVEQDVLDRSGSQPEAAPVTAARVDEDAARAAVKRVFDRPSHPVPDGPDPVLEVRPDSESPGAPHRSRMKGLRERAQKSRESVKQQTERMRVRARLAADQVREKVKVTTPLGHELTTKDSVKSRVQKAVRHLDPSQNQQAPTKAQFDEMRRHLDDQDVRDYMWRYDPRIKHGRGAFDNDQPRFNIDGSLARPPDSGPDTLTMPILDLEDPPGSVSDGNTLTMPVIDADNVPDDQPSAATESVPSANRPTGRPDLHAVSDRQDLGSARPESRIELHEQLAKFRKGIRTWGEYDRLGQEASALAATIQTDPTVRRRYEAMQQTLAARVMVFDAPDQVQHVLELLGMKPPVITKALEAARRVPDNAQVAITFGRDDQTRELTCKVDFVRRERSRLRAA